MSDKDCYETKCFSTQTMEHFARNAHQYQTIQKLKSFFDDFDECSDEHSSFLEDLASRFLNLAEEPDSG